ncbi:MAG: PilC/PilY family type IV pilus protein [Thermodesulfobacteriota bacterium]
MKENKTRKMETGVRAGDTRPEGAGARARFFKPVLWLTALVMLGLALASPALAARWYRDADNDGFGNPASYYNGSWSAGYVSNNTDCNDADATVYPGAPELCDGKDNDCDTVVDENCVPWYQDADGDGYGNPGVSVIASTQPAGYVSNNTDCDDANAAINPGATEICDDLNNDCDGSTDEGCVLWYRDLDGDGYGNPSVTKEDFAQPTGYVADSTDCNDGNAAVHPGATEVCDDQDNDCDGSTDEGCQIWYRDADADGYGNLASSQEAVIQPAGYVSNSTDCDDTNAAIHPGVAEICDTVDNNCNGAADEGCQTWYQDADGDTFGNPAVSVLDFVRPAGYVADNTDCDDADATIYPDAPEVPADGIDNDCDGSVDEGEVWYRDADGDGYGNAADTSVVPGPGYVLNKKDCDDTDPSVNPAAVEVCEDGIDNDCDGGVDENCSLWYQDADGDGYGNAASSVMASSQPGGYVADNTDCDDTRNTVNPGAMEICADALDNDCDGSTDEGCQTWYQDADGDTYGNSAVSVVLVDQPAGYVGNNTDCDDTNAAIFPKAPELCDGVDNNCNTFTDEGCVHKWYQDADGDSYGNPAVFVTENPPAGYVPVPGDCDDTNAAVNPGANEVCDDGLDNNCAGGDSEGCLTWYQDSDNDGFGNPAATTMAFTQPAGYVSVPGDCNDANGTIYPGAPEICDGLDSDCDGTVDDGCQSWYEDADGDNYGNPAVSTSSATPPVGYINNDGDCDDTNASINPGADEVCADGQDNDCDGSTDEGCQVWYEDADGDTYGNPAVSIQSSDQPAGHVERAGDCDDANAAIYPGAEEVCDGVDNNCAGGVDEGCVQWYRDMDGDTFGVSADMLIAVSQPAGYAARGGDCDDANAAVNPDAVEVCDGVNNDCDSALDEGCTTWYRDADGDTYGAPAVSMASTSQPAGYVAMAGDCDDADAAVHPGAAEICGDGQDNDCDGTADEGCITWYRDADGDNYGNPAVPLVATGQPAGYVGDNSDCNDGDPLINPSAVEACDGVDNNCAGGVDDGCLTWYRDADGDGYGNAGVSMVSIAQPAGYVLDQADCDDADPLINPGAIEICDGINDDDCDGSADEGCTTWYQDADVDGYGNPGVSTVSIAQPAGYVQDGTDCDDTNAGVNPSLPEVCGDGLDNNCSGGADEGCLTWYRDADGDNYGNAGDSMVTNTQPAGYVPDNTDCDDAHATVHPGAAEVCGDGLDNNCAGGVDEGCLTWYQDADGDTYGNGGASVVSATQPAGHVARAGDCNDTNPAVNPGAVEICGDGLDNDCAGGDAACTTWYQDADGDGYGNPGVSVVSVDPPIGYRSVSGDCDDTNPNINPGAVEVCGDGVDNDCAGGDAACATWYQDADADGYGNNGVSMQAAARPHGYVADNTDCNDGNAAVNPGVAEICGDGVDNDCAGGDAVCATWYQDADADGYGNNGVSMQAAARPHGYVADNTDCNDADVTVNPGAVEVCGDGVDNDCAGGDAACATWYQDADGDGYGNNGVSMQAAARPHGYVADNTDCNDADVTVNPGAVEICGDGVDNDCAGGDAACATWYQDADGDGYGNSGATLQAENRPHGYVADNTDCDDANAAVNPGAREICGDGVDNNCDGWDPGCCTYYRDGDGDGHGSANPADAVQNECGPLPGGYVWSSDDCDDANPAVHPGAGEICNGVDDNCIAGIDEGCNACYHDDDKDGYGDAADPRPCAAGLSVPNGLDCDDNNPAVYPGAPEVCGDAAWDNDCDGIGEWDEGCRNWCRDVDGDGFGGWADCVSSMTQPAGYELNSSDCNDNDPTVYPGAPEICDGRDNNCNGQRDETCDTWYEDADGDGFGNASVSVTSPVRPYGYVTDNRDCDDANPNVNPKAAEICNGVDDNCVNGIDESCSDCYDDADGDGYGNPAIACACGSCPSGNSAANGLDCDDTNPGVHPGAVEICWNGLDDDCSGGDGCANTYYRDADGDGHGDPGNTILDEDRPDGYVWNGDDCDDTNPAVHPGAPELCNGVDDNCVGGIDEGCNDCYEDTDGDGYGNPGQPCICGSCATWAGAGVNNGLDCNDSDPSVHPGAPEICGDGQDNDCDGLWDWDEGCLNWRPDFDGDGYGNDNWALAISSMTAPAGYVLDAWPFDCNDDDPAVNPGATELCDGKDNNCNGWKDEGCDTWYQDSDGDNYGDSSIVVVSLVRPYGYVAVNGDCDDANAAVHPGAVELCGDGLDNDCAGGDAACTTWYRDADGDNYGNSADSLDTADQPPGYVTASGDCDDTNPAVHPGAVEICGDGLDNDCAGGDAVCTTWYRDADGDNYGNSADFIDAADQPAGYVVDGTDCDDADYFINPGAVEICGNFIDENCDGLDAVCMTWYRDADGDNYGNSADSLDTADQPPGYVTDNTDCDDANPAVHPGAVEICGDTLDNDCVGGDAACTTWYRDADGDNYGNSADFIDAADQPPGYVTASGDCDDTNPAVHPGAVEICGDGLDNDCAGGDAACTTWYRDVDHDGYGNPGVSVQAEDRPDGYVADNTDCNDGDAAINPAAVDICDGIDNDCSGGADEGCLIWYQDGDGDGYGNPGVTLSQYYQPANYVSDNTDCNDGNAAVNPGHAEVCNDGLDNDCDGNVDDGCVVWYQDADADNYGNAAVSTTTVIQPAGFVPDSTDCNDGDAMVNPGMPEVCGDGLDNNCNGLESEGCLTWYQDVDADNYGNAAVSVWSITEPAGYVSDSTDCDDTRATVNPGHVEVCNDGLDNDCDGTADEGCMVWYQDNDGDNFGSAVSTIAVIRPAGYVAASGDCNDANAAVHPGATEICGDGLDNDCDGATNEGCLTWYRDADGDTYGTFAVTVMGVVQPAGYVDRRGDCNDGNAAVHPGAVEVCEDGLDNDCDGLWEEGCQTWYQDADGDNWGDHAVSTVTVIQPPGYVSRRGDCNDSDAAINPDAIEICDGVDNDCFGDVDEGCVTWHQDLDNDSFGDPAISMQSVSQPLGFVADGTDCDDGNGDINPGETEVCDDGIDNDCDGAVDEACVIWYQDTDGDGYGNSAVTAVAVSDPGGYAPDGGDCDDTNAAVNPGVAETCDGIDNDCDGLEDEGCVDWYQDNDGDGYGSVFTVSDFTQPAGYVNVPGDCNDADPAIHFGAVEVCDGVDNDCDGELDEGCFVWYQDADNDRYGNTAVNQRSIARPAGYVAASGDCNDANAVIHPYMLDLCDHLDNDCDAEYDEDVPAEEYRKYYADNDGDGYGNAAVWVEDCMLPEFGFVENSTDCNDNKADIHPGAFDICENGVDEDCNGEDRLCGTATVRGCADIANTPLETLVNAAPPIVLLLLDASQSMSYDIMVPIQPDSLYRGEYDVISAVDKGYWQASWCKMNTIYYDPDQIYTPWDGISSDTGLPYIDAGLEKVSDHPNQPPNIFLDSVLNKKMGVNIILAHYYAWSSLEQRPYLVMIVDDGAGYAVKYYQVNPPGDNVLVNGSIVTTPTTTANLPIDVVIPQAWADGNKECSAAEAMVARQNFANWYQYYHVRMLTAQATLAKVVAQVSGIQFALNTVGVVTTSFLPPTLVDSTPEGEINRQAVITAIFKAGWAESSTDLRKNYEEMGEYLAGEINKSGRPAPWATEEDGGACQMSFVILMTDAQYNKSSVAKAGDEDGDGNTDFDGPPFADAHGQESTLADIAMKYYETDLNLDLPNSVPTTVKDTAEHQHMVTFSVSFGAIGTLDPKGYIFDQYSSNCAPADDPAENCTVDAPCNCAPYWPEVPSTQDNAREKIDDLYHAAVNGRGEYFATRNVNQLAYALKQIFEAINERRGSGASVAVSTQELTEDTMLYRGLYNTSGWWGELGCWQIDPDTGNVNDTPTWLASELLDARDLSTDPRSILSYNPDLAQGITFDLGNLSDEQKLWLGGSNEERQRLIDFIKGDRSEEIKNGGYLRDRVSRLGDIIHSAPVHVLYSDGTDYLYVGGNDGMLHAFDASSSGTGGQEIFAYVPSYVYENLVSLSDPNYSHKYYVDTTPYVDKSGLLVGGLGAGGKGYFALDVSDPRNFSTGDVLWEYPPGVDDDMGFSFSKPITVPHESGRVVLFGNGYDSKNGRSVLYALRIDANNAIVEVRKIDTLTGSQSGDPANPGDCNGLSNIAPTDMDYDGNVDYVYGGDLQGNMWKFDLNAPTAAGWKVAYGTAAAPQPLFHAEHTAGVPQPIVGMPDVMRHCLTNRAGYIVVFGTGSFFANGDYQDTSTQSIYGIWDWADELAAGGIVNPENYPLGAPTRMTDYASLPVSLGGASPVTFALLGQSETAVSDEFRVTSQAKLYDKYIDPDGIPNNADDQRAWFDAELWESDGAAYTGVRYVGWYFDLPDSGERVVADATIRAGLAIMVSVDPSPMPCKIGGHSILQLLQACDGSRPDDEVLDTNDDGVIDADDIEANRKDLDDIYYKPVIIEDKMYFSEDDPEQGPSEALGVAYWRFLRVLR